MLLGKSVSANFKTRKRTSVKEDESTGKTVEIKGRDIEIYNMKLLELKLKEVKVAQEEYSHFTQEQVDEIFKCAAMAANQQRIALAKLAVNVLLAVIVPLVEGLHPLNVVV